MLVCTKFLSIFWKFVEVRTNNFSLKQFVSSRKTSLHELKIIVNAVIKLRIIKHSQSLRTENDKTSAWDDSRIFTECCVLCVVFSVFFSPSGRNTLQTQFGFPIIIYLNNFRHSQRLWTDYWKFKIMNYRNPKIIGWEQIYLEVYRLVNKITAGKKLAGICVAIILKKIIVLKNNWLS